MPVTRARRQRSSGRSTTWPFAGCTQVSDFHSRPARSYRQRRCHRAQNRREDIHAPARYSYRREWWPFSAHDADTWSVGASALLAFFIRTSDWNGLSSISHIDRALLERIGVSQSSDFYLCGPSSFLQNMRDGLRNWGVPAGNVHTEIFGSLEAITPGMAQVDHTPHVPQGGPGFGPPVSFARSGITAAWDPKYQSLLELAEACDIPVRWSCRTGVCHTCMTGLISGLVVYSPEPLERPARGNVLVCCSQPNADVTLDL